MPDASQVRQNIKRSVQEYLAGLTLTWTDANGVAQAAPLLYDATLAQVPDKGAWVDLLWRRNRSTPMASPQRDRAWNIELQVWSRIKDDPLQANLDGLVGQLLNAMRNGQADKRIPLWDYANPANPVATPYYVRISNPVDDYVPSTNLVYGRSITATANYFERY